MCAQCIVAFLALYANTFNFTLKSEWSRRFAELLEFLKNCMMKQKTIPIVLCWYLGIHYK